MRVMQVVTAQGWDGAEHLACTLANGLADKMHSLMLAPQGAQILARLSAKVQGMPLMLGNGFRPSLILPFVRLVRREKIDLIDCHSSHAHNFALLVRRLLPRVKFVVHRHNIYRPANGWLGRYKYLHGGIDRFICVSQAVRRVLLDCGVAPQHARLVLGAVPRPSYDDGAKQRQRQKIFATYRLNADLPVIGTLATLLERRKGYDTLLQALRLLKADGVPVQAIFCGQGPDRQKLEDRCRDFNLHENVRFAGFVADIYSLLTAVDVFCLPSRNEALGLAVQEAAHAGCCVIATDGGGIPEMITHEHSGLLSEAGNARALASNLSRVLTSKSVRQRLASNAQRDIAQKFTVHTMIDATAQVYEELLSA